MSILVKLAIITALLGALYGAERAIEGRGYTRAMAEAQQAVDQIKRDAARTLATETAKTRAAELALQAFTDTQNDKDATHEKTVTTLAARLRAAADPAGRLRDPHATAGCGGGGGGPAAGTASAAGAGAADAALPGGLLSAELSGLLRERLEQADRINDAYASCRAVALRERELPKN